MDLFSIVSYVTDIFPKHDAQKKYDPGNNFSDHLAPKLDKWQFGEVKLVKILYDYYYTFSP